MKALLKALGGFQSECPAVKKSADNPFFKSKYATLDAIQHHIQPYLSKYGLVVVQKNVVNDGLFVMTEIYDASSGECISSVFPIIVQKNTPQEYGSAVSYAKRYSLSGLLNLVIADEDDDGNASSQVTIINEKPSDKPWLNEGTEAFDKVKKFITDGGKLTDVKKKYNISKKVSDLLTK
jgi:hypothetical protein